MSVSPPISSQKASLHMRLIQEARANWPLFSWVIIAGFLASLAGVGGAWCLSHAIGGVFLRGKTVSEISLLLILFLAAITVRGVFTWCCEEASSRFAIQIKTRLRERTYAYILSQGPGFTYRERSGNLSNLLTEGMEALDPYYGQYLPQIIFAILIPLLILVYVSQLDLLSGLILFLTAPIIPLFMVLIGNVADTLTKNQWQMLSRMSAYFLDIIQGLTTLKTLGRSQDQVTKIARISEQFRQITMNVLRVTFLSALVMELTATLSTAIIAVEVGLRLIYGKMAFEPAFLILILAPEFYLPIRLLGLRFHAGMAGAEAGRTILEILDKPQPTFNEKRTENREILAPNKIIRFEDVSYEFENGKPAAEGISFELKPDQITALIGPSGAGKSTIASLLLGFIMPTRGRIFLGDQDIRGIPIDHWRNQLAWVPQKPYIFNDTVRANIQFAYPQANLDEIQESARLAHADEFIQKLPQGYETVLGERGTRLSGGQIQRIALARAFLKNAPLLILDEPTSHLDPVNEAALQDSLKTIMKDRSVLVIAHRLYTVYLANQILVLEEGKLIESGTHDQLMLKKGLYWNMLKQLGKPVEGKEYIELNEGNDLQKNLEGTEERDKTDTYQYSNKSRIPESRFRALLHLIGLLSPFSGWVLLSIILGVATIASSIGLMSTSAYIISAAALQPSIAELQVAIVGVRFFGIARGIFRYLERLVSHQVTFRLLAGLRTWFYQALEPLVPARLLSMRSGDLLSRIISDIAALENFYIRGAEPSLVAFLIMLGLTVVMFRIDSRLAILFMVFVTVTCLFLPLSMAALGRLPGSHITQDRARLNAIYVDGIQGIADLTAYSQLPNFLRKVNMVSQSLASAQKTLGRVNSSQLASLFFSTNLAMWAILVMASILVQQGELSGVVLGAICLAVLTSFESVQTLPQAASFLGKDLEAAQRLMEVVKTQPMIHIPNQPQRKPEHFKIDVEQLSFAYPDYEPISRNQPQIRKNERDRSGQTLPYVLKNITFSVNKGEHLAIVGPSGAGKSTLVSLLLRFWDYSEGRILLDGYDLREYSPEDSRKLFNVVTQTSYLFTGTIRENLLIANPQSSDDQIDQAVRRARLYNFIQMLPDKYQTWIGEQGLRLSAGERQRLVLARAFLRDTPVLIHDEVTANLDTLLEQEILAEINKFCLDRARLTITHRLVGLEDAKEVLVLDHGQIIQRGRHSELIRKKGLYRRMWDLQTNFLLR
jgi:ATP-binding cassette, subfamily C, bacterial CydCD